MVQMVLKWCLWTYQFLWNKLQADLLKKSCILIKSDLQKFYKKEKKYIANLSYNLHVYCKIFIFLNTLELIGGFGE